MCISNFLAVFLYLIVLLFCKFLVEVLAVDLFVGASKQYSVCLWMKCS